MTDEERKSLIASELAYYATLKKTREERLSSLRKEFPDVPAENIVNKYKAKVDEHFTVNSAARNKGPL